MAPLAMIGRRLNASRDSGGALPCKMRKRRTAREIEDEGEKGKRQGCTGKSTCRLWIGLFPSRDKATDANSAGCVYAVLLFQIILVGESRSSERVNCKISYLSNYPLKRVRTDPVEHQASVPEWKDAPSVEYTDDYKAATLPKLGTVVYPLNMDISATNKSEKKRKRLVDKCKCSCPGSEDCVRVHVKKARSWIKDQLGEEAFKNCGLDAMGEQVGEQWTTVFKRKLEKVDKLIPQNKHQKFMEIALKELGQKETKDLAKYYYNVFLPRRLASLTRAEHKKDEAVDTSDEKSDQEDGENEHHPRKKSKKSSGSSSTSRRRIRKLEKAGLRDKSLQWIKTDIRTHAVADLQRSYKYEILIIVTGDGHPKQRRGRPARPKEPGFSAAAGPPANLQPAPPPPGAAPLCRPRNLAVNSAQPSAVAMGTVAIYSLFIINKSGGLIYYKDYGSAGRMDTNDSLRLASLWHSMHAISQQLSPTTGCTGIDLLQAHNFDLHCFQSLTGLHFP
uniref:Trafficking protein particle complex subunit 4 n=1 Tax=Aegilops tauschii TaxID=37682 RepID=R7WFV0_AEGTA